MTALTPHHPHDHARTRWLVLFLLCLGELMIVLDTTIVNVALPSIRLIWRLPKPAWCGW